MTTASTTLAFLAGITDGLSPPPRADAVRATLLEMAAHQSIADLPLTRADVHTGLGITSRSADLASEDEAIKARRRTCGDLAIALAEAAGRDGADQAGDPLRWAAVLHAWGEVCVFAGGPRYAAMASTARREVTEIESAPTRAELDALDRATAGGLPDSDLYHVVLSHDLDGDATAGRVSISQATGRRYVSIDAETAVTLRS